MRMNEYKSLAEYATEELAEEIQKRTNFAQFISSPAMINELIRREVSMKQIVDSWHGIKFEKEEKEEMSHMSMKHTAQSIRVQTSKEQLELAGGYERRRILKRLRSSSFSTPKREQSNSEKKQGLIDDEEKAEDKIEQKKGMGFHREQIQVRIQPSGDEQSIITDNVNRQHSLLIDVKQYAFQHLVKIAKDAELITQSEYEEFTCRFNKNLQNHPYLAYKISAYYPTQYYVSGEEVPFKHYHNTVASELKTHYQGYLKNNQNQIERWKQDAIKKREINDQQRQFSSVQSIAVDSQGFIDDDDEVEQVCEYSSEEEFKTERDQSKSIENEVAIQEILLRQAKKVQAKEDSEDSHEIPTRKRHREQQFEDSQQVRFGKSGRKKSKLCIKSQAQDQGDVPVRFKRLKKGQDDQ